MIQFEVEVYYGTFPITVKADNLPELHEALSGIAELNRDARFLKGQGVENVVPTYRQDANENEYYGWGDAKDTRHGVTFGRKRKESAVPFFPKGRDGYYDPETAQQRPHRQEQQRPQQRAPQPDTQQPDTRAGNDHAGAPQRPDYEDAYPDDDLPF